MAKVQEFYKGRRKRRNYAFIPFIVLLAIISVTLVLFYGMQQYAVISKDGVAVELPILSDGSRVTVDSSGRKIVNFESVNAEIVFDPPDYSSVKSVAGTRVPELRAIFVPAENINAEKLQEYAARLKRGNALVLEMKPRSGEMLWESKSLLSANYALAPVTDRTTAMPELIANLKKQEIYLVAQISCCIDERLAASSSLYCIHTEIGMNYRDDVGTWIDAYNLDVRQWIAEMVQELYDLGFDEVVLADMAHPILDAENPPALLYTRDISTPRSTVNAVCGLALDIADRLQDRTKLLSIYTDTKLSLVKADESTGQDVPLFLKVYDRVFIRTDRFAYPYHVDDIEGRYEIGDPHDRLVPVVENYIPDDNSSWILVDVDEEE